MYKYIGKEKKRVKMHEDNNDSSQIPDNLDESTNKIMKYNSININLICLIKKIKQD